MRLGIFINYTQSIPEVRCGYVYFLHNIFKIFVNLLFLIQNYKFDGIHSLLMSYVDAVNFFGNVRLLE